MTDIEKEKQAKDFIDNTHRQFKALEDKITELKDSSSLEEVKGTIQTIQDSLQIEDKGMADFVKTLQEHANALEVRVKDFEQQKGIEPITLTKSIDNALDEDKYKAFAKSKGSGRHSFELKAAADLLTSDWTAGSGTVGLPQMSVPGVSQHPWNALPIWNSISKRFVGEFINEIRYVYELTRTDGSARVAEGAAIPQSAKTWKAEKVDFEKIATFAKVSRESLEDAEYVRGEINDLINSGVKAEVESLLTTGSGSSTLLGLETAAKTFSLPDGMNPVQSANLFDVINYMAAFVGQGVNAATAGTDANKTGYLANIALVHSLKFTELISQKDGNDNYLQPPFVRLNGNSIQVGNVMVMASNYVSDVDTVVVYDSRKANAYIKRNMTVEMSDNVASDFLSDFTTIKATIRLLNLITIPDKFAFCTSTFTAAQALIDDGGGQ